MTAIDDAVLRWVVDHRTPLGTDFFEAVSTVGNTVAVAAVTVAVAAVLVTRGRRADGLAVLATVLSCWAAMNGLKFATRRARPPLPDRVVDLSTYSFPSGHAMMSAVVVTVVVVLLVENNRSVATIAASTALGAVTLLIGLSRIYLAAHWFTDVVAGWAIGIAWGWAVLSLLRRLRTGSAGLIENAGPTENAGR